MSYFIYITNSTTDLLIQIHICLLDHQRRAQGIIGVVEEKEYQDLDQVKILYIIYIWK